MPPEETTSQRELPRVTTPVEANASHGRSDTELPPAPVADAAGGASSVSPLAQRVPSRVAMDIPAPPPSAPSQDDPLVGAVIAERYRLIERVGEGGMGAVYRGEHLSLRKRVAVKFLHAEMSRVPDVVARFEREAIAAANLEHANVVAAHDFGRTKDGQFFLVMEFVQGGSLRDLLETEKALAPGRTLHIARHIAAALNRAHSLGIVHRDLKPENVVLVDREGDKDFAKVIDFGIAKVSAGRLADGGQVLTQAGMVFGTPDYMAPEQALGGKVDHRADLYAFGVMVFEMLAGKRPFEAEDVMVLLGKHMTATPPNVSEVAPPGSVPPEVDPVVARMLAKSPSERFPSAFEFITAFETALGMRSGPAMTPPFGVLAPPPSAVTGTPPASSAVSVPPAPVATGSVPSLPPRVRRASQTARIAVEAVNTALKTNYAELRKDPDRHRRALVVASVVAAIALLVGIVTRPRVRAPIRPLPTLVASQPVHPRGPRHGAPTPAAPAQPPDTEIAAPADGVATPTSGDAAPGMDAELATRLDEYKHRPEVAALLAHADDRGQLRGVITAFETVAVRSPRDPMPFYILGTLYMRDRKSSDAAVERFSEALSLEPGFANDPVLVRHFVQRYTRSRRPPPRVEALLDGPLARAAVPQLVDVSLNADNANERRRAADLLASPAMAGYLDATSRGLIELSTARRCEDKLPIVQRLGEQGDGRAVPALMALHAGQPGCGGWFRRAVCNPCLADAVPTAIRAIQSRAH